MKHLKIFERFFDIGDMTDYTIFVLDETYIKFDDTMRGNVKIRIPNDNDQFEKFEIYDDGKIKLENWYPSDLHIKIVGHIYNNVESNSIRDKIKKHLIYLIKK